MVLVPVYPALLARVATEIVYSKGVVEAMWLEVTSMLAILAGHARFTIEWLYV